MLLLCVRALVFIRAYEVPSASIHPTLLENDRILVITYGPLGGPPQPGDIAVLRHAPEGEEPEVFVKRVVAVGGQKIRITPGRLVVDGQTIVEPYIAEAMTYWWPTNETLAGDEEPQMQLDGDSYVVPEEHVVVLGDNRNAAEDSFFWGAIPETELIGRAFYRYAPSDRRGRLDSEEPCGVAFAGERPPSIAAPTRGLRTEPLPLPGRIVPGPDAPAGPESTGPGPRPRRSADSP